MKNNYRDVLDRLIGIRTDMNLTKHDMAQKLIIDRSLYSRIEKGTRAVTNDVLIRMFRIGVDIDYLVTGIKTENTDLNILLEKCMLERRTSFINIVVSYMNVFLKSDNHKKLYCRRELEILKYNIDKMNGESVGTVWMCIRKIHGFTQNKMAEILEVDIKTYRKIEKGTIMPTLEIFTHLYNRLGYYPTLVEDFDSNYLLMINNVWKELSMEKKRRLSNIADKNLKDINSI